MSSLVGSSLESLGIERWIKLAAGPQRPGGGSQVIRLPPDGEHEPLVREGTPSLQVG